MGKFNPFTALVFNSLSIITTYTTVSVLSTSIDHNNHNKMANSWIPVRQHNSGRGIPRGGGRGGRVGRPYSPGLEQQPPGSPIANTLFVQQGIPSSHDNILNTFLEVLTLYLILAFHCISVVPAHAKMLDADSFPKSKMLYSNSHKKIHQSTTQHSPAPTPPSGTDNSSHYHIQRNGPSCIKYNITRRPHQPKLPNSQK